jgi:hypothetical protein
LSICAGNLAFTGRRPSVALVSEGTNITNEPGGNTNDDDQQDCDKQRQVEAEKARAEKETVRDLSGDKAGAVRGGARNQSQCSYDYSGCIN